MSADDDILKQFGERVRQLRKAQNLSQEYIGLEAGLEQSYVSDIELGRRNVSLKNIRALAKVLQVTLTELFDGLG